MPSVDTIPRLLASPQGPVLVLDTRSASSSPLVHSIPHMTTLSKSPRQLLTLKNTDTLLVHHRDTATKQVEEELIYLLSPTHILEIFHPNDFFRPSDPYLSVQEIDWNNGDLIIRHSVRGRTVKVSEYGWRNGRICSLDKVRPVGSLSGSVGLPSSKSTALTSSINAPSLAPSHTPTPTTTQTPDFIADLTFNLSLTDAQRKTKDSLTLPYTHIQIESRPTPQPSTGGEIHYEFDNEDSFDEDDPDADLEI